MRYHMSDTKIIMSVDRPNHTDLEASVRRSEFEYLLDRTGFTFEVCEGSWEGEREQSYMIYLPAGEGYTMLKNLAFDRYDQDAVIRVTAYGGVKLKGRDKTCQWLGQWTEVDAIPADQCYTQSFKTGKIYVSVEA